MSGIAQQELKTTLSALEGEPVPANRRGTRFGLVTANGVILPPKYVVTETVRRAGRTVPVSFDSPTACRWLEPYAQMLGFRVECEAGALVPAGLGRAVAPKTWSLRVGLVVPDDAAETRSWLLGLAAGALEGVDLLLLPETFDCCGKGRSAKMSRWSQFAARHGIAVAVGVWHSAGRGHDHTPCRSDDSDYHEIGGQELWFFSGDGELVVHYLKHANTHVSALDTPGYRLDESLPVVTVKHVPVGLTLCHDHYIAPLQARLAQRGARILLNPSMHASSNQLVKWMVCQRARAVENKVFSLCALSSGVARAYPIGFSPSGRGIEFKRWEPTIDGPLWICELGSNYQRPGVADRETVRALARVPGKYYLRIRLPAGDLRLEVLSPTAVGGQRARLQWRANQVADTGVARVLMLPPQVLFDPVRAWKAVAANDLAGWGTSPPASGRFVIWCHLDREPTQSERWLAQSRTLELCMPVILSSSGVDTFSAYGLVIGERKVPAAAESVLVAELPLSAVQGGGYRLALGPLREPGCRSCVATELVTTRISQFSEALRSL